MTRVVAVANQKGGVGKTTTAISLAWELAARGHTCLLIDIDPQANATSGLGQRAGETSMYDVLVDEAPLEAAILRVTENLHLAPASADLAGAEVELVPAMAREYRLRRVLEGLTVRYDFVIIDCPPSLGLLTLNALTAAGEALVPVQCEYLALEGLSQLVRTLEAVRRNLNPSLRVGGLLLTMFDGRTNLGQQVAEEVRRHFPGTFRTVIPRNVRVSEAPSHGLAVGQYAPSSPAARAYRAFAAEFAERGAAVEAKA
ncbi:MAG TPA: AAA family ATPase [Dehalococcoidia bacterium]|nr:AAA family ATPase [Dehalococcoidia bacterium]